MLVTLRKEIENLWGKFLVNIGKTSVPSLVHVLCAEPHEVQLWHVDTISSLLLEHVNKLDRVLERERRDEMKRKVEEEQHFFWQLAKERKPRPPPSSRKKTILYPTPGIFFR